jgi:hypothetical protein
MTTNIYDLHDTWTDAGTVFYAIKMNVTTTAYAVGSKLLELESNGVHQFSVDPTQGVRVGNATGGTTGPGTINAVDYLVNGSPLGVLYAKLSSPVFIGTPQAPTQPNADNGANIATTAFVKNVAQPLDADLTSLAAASAFGGGPTPSGLFYRKAADTWRPLNLVNLTLDAATDTLTGSSGGGGGGIPEAPIDGIYYGRRNAAWANLSLVYQPIGNYAPIASPVFTGDPQAPTPATADNDTSIATTAFVKAQGYALLASPTFTGDPKAPTATPGDNDTSIATTAFVTAAIAAAPYVLRAGDTMTGQLSVSYVSPFIRVIKAAAGQAATITGQVGANLRWTLALGDAAAETGSNAGSDFSVTRYNDAGVLLSTPFVINRASGNITVGGSITLPSNPSNPLEAAPKQYVDAQISGLQPLDGDLTAIAGLTGTNTIYYRSGTSAWSPVTIGSGLSFASGTLSAPTGGGNVSSSGTPNAGDWAQWVDATHIKGMAPGAMPYVLKAGDFMTGGLTLQYSQPQIWIDKLASGENSVIVGSKGLLARWALVLGDINAESGANAGSSFALSRYSDAGAFIDNPMFITRSTGLLTVTADPTAPLGVATKQYVDTRIPVLCPQAGRLEWASSTVLTFKPENGNRILINGVYYVIPQAGIAGLTNMGSVYYNGVPGTSLPGSLRMYVYAFNNAGTITADFSTTLPNWDTTTGVWIKNGDPSRSLIGLVSCNAGVVPSRSQVASLFNRLPRVASAGFANFSWSQNAMTPAVLNICNVVSWANEKLEVVLNTLAFNSLAGQYGLVQLAEAGSGDSLTQRTCLAPSSNINPNEFMYKGQRSQDSGLYFTVWVLSQSASNTFTIANNILTVSVG